MNLLGACDQLNGRNCSGIRGNIWLTIDPRTPTCETLIKYKRNGEAFSEIPEIDRDILTLKLNAWQLVENRKKIIDHASERILVTSKKTSGNYPKALLEKEINYWSSTVNGQYREYCMAAVHYLQSKLKYAK